RRHTRFSRDWSSDVCSSDLKRAPTKASVMVQLEPGYRLATEQVAAIVNLISGSVPNLKPEDVGVVDQYGALLSRGLNVGGGPAQNWQAVEDYQQIGRASCRERVEHRVVDGAL